MTQTRDFNPVLHEVEVALEASCGALMTLQGINSGPDGADGQPERVHVAQAIQSLRNAIEELRRARSSATSALTMGFVLASGQSMPRRTA